MPQAVTSAVTRKEKEKVYHHFLRTIEEGIFPKKTHFRHTEKLDMLGQISNIHKYP